MWRTCRAVESGEAQPTEGPGAGVENILHSWAKNAEETVQRYTEAFPSRSIARMLCHVLSHGFCGTSEAGDTRFSIVQGPDSKYFWILETRFVTRGPPGIPPG